MTDTYPLFVYGTLRSDAGHPMHSLVAQGGHPMGRATVAGRLWDAGAYPVALLGSGERTIQGEVYRLAPERAEEALAALHRYEGCAAEGGLFRRVSAEALLASGRWVTCWVYVWTGGTDGMPTVPDGDWVSMLRGRGRSEENRQ